MTISASYAPPEYTGTGLDSALSTVFTFHADSEVVVTSRVIASGVETVLTLDTHYSLSGGGVSGSNSHSVGTVTAITGATNFPTTVTWKITRVTPVSQSLDYQDNQSFPGTSHESGLDRISMIQQEAAGREVLLATDSGTAQSSLSVTSNDWPVTCDSVRLECIGLLASTTASLLIKPIDNGSASTTSLSSTTETRIGTTAVHLIGTSSTWQTHTSHLIDTAQADALFGEAVIHYNAGGLVGRAEFVYQTSEGEPTGVSLWLHRGTSGTRWDGFDVSPSAGTLSGTIRLWGLPKS